MESEPHMQLDLYNCMPQSHLRTTFFQLSNQNERMIGFPEGQLSEEHHADKSISYDGLLHRDSFNYHQDLCLGGTSFGSASDINSSAVHLQEGSALESLRAMYSSSCSYGSSSSVPPSLSNGYDGLVGLMQPESSWRASTSYMEPIGFSEVRDTNNWAYETLRTQNELCLSLATTGPSFPQCLDLGYSGMFESSQSQRRLGLEHNSQRSQCNEELSLGPRSSSQSAQFPQSISGSKYRAVLQQILSDVSSFSLDSVDQANYSMSNSMSSNSNVPFSSEQFLTDEFGVNERSVDAPEGSSHRKQSKKLQLLSLLQVVDDQYSRCLDEIHTVISAFHAASELDPQLHACFALQSVSFFYKNLRQRISNQILEMGMDDEAGGDSRKSFEKCFLQKQWALQQLKKKDQQLWKPQRGLPERSVAVLRAWMFDNFLHPYPKDAEKHLLAIKSGLSRSQVSNWFINARVRLWKPMVEEMCSELNRRKSNRQIEEGSNNRSNQLSIYDFNQRLDA